MLKPLIATVLLAASTALLAQSPAAPGAEGKERRHARADCSKAADPKACEERQKARKERLDKMKAAHAKARQACEGRKGDEHRDCMVKQTCSAQADPAKCEARAKEHAQKRQERRDARQKAEKK